MNWKGRKLRTYGDIMWGVENCKSPEEAQEFVRLYEAEEPYARDNIGYLAGYFDNETKHQIFDWFGCQHPIFGKKDPTFMEALTAGIKTGKEYVNCTKESK